MYNVGFIGGGAGTVRRSRLFKIEDVDESASALTEEQLATIFDRLISERDETQRKMDEQDRRAQKLGWKFERDKQLNLILVELDGNRSYRFPQHE